MNDVIRKDILGTAIKVGDIVAYPDHNNMRIGTVTKINPKMINVVAISRRVPDRKYPTDLLVVVDDPKITMYMLKYQK
jgi:hypothetical protein